MSPQVRDCCRIMKDCAQRKMLKPFYSLFRIGVVWEVRECKCLKVTGSQNSGKELSAVGCLGSPLGSSRLSHCLPVPFLSPNSSHFQCLGRAICQSASMLVTRSTSPSTGYKINYFADRNDTLDIIAFYFFFSVLLSWILLSLRGCWRKMCIFQIF